MALVLNKTTRRHAERLMEENNMTLDELASYALHFYVRWDQDWRRTERPNGDPHPRIKVRV
ncbi:MAG: hypothetical protein HYT80_01070 [Euryarchaeota archaeon]|nr:hypothetical protein [Euryarchaeota archaeon]